MPPLAFLSGSGSKEEVFGHLDFGWPQLLSNLVPLGLGHDIAALDDHDVALWNRLFGEETPSVNVISTLFCFWRKIGQVHARVLSLPELGLNGSLEGVRPRGKKP